MLLGTHAWSWSLTGDGRLSPRALAAIDQADTVFVSPIGFFEIARKTRIGKWSEMTPLPDQLPGLLRRRGRGR